MHGRMMALTRLTSPCVGLLRRCREIEAEYTGRLRRVRPLPECLCDAASTPALLSRGRYCGADAVAKGTSSRLDQTHHEVEFVNDGVLSTAWASRRQSPNKIEIQINFRRPVEVKRTLS